MVATHKVVPMEQYLPLFAGRKGEQIAAFDMKFVEKVGLVKFDFLGLRYLTILDNAERELGRRIAPTVVILDPPRAGCDKELINYVSSLNPTRIVYISCNPETLARDCAFLTKNGYTVKKVVPVDMFPHTAHVECVCLIERKM